MPRHGKNKRADRLLILRQQNRLAAFGWKRSVSSFPAIPRQRTPQRTIVRFDDASGFGHGLCRCSGCPGVAPVKSLQGEDGPFDLLPLRAKLRNDPSDIHKSLLAAHLLPAACFKALHG
jgi:hypothetical protein